MGPRKHIAAGNWKMNGCLSDLSEINQIAVAADDLKGIVTVMCLPATLLDRAFAMTGKTIAIGAQDCHHALSGAHTGDISAAMISDIGAQYVIVGHSERRSDHGEDNATIAAKTRAAWSVGLTAVLCIGETQDQYRAGDTLDVLATQIKQCVCAGATPANTVTAYEPIWAIGTGLTPGTDEIQTTHAAIRADLKAQIKGGDMFSILYGGSVKPANAAEIFSLNDVDGGLVGGASMKAVDFTAIMHALHGAKSV